MNAWLIAHNTFREATRDRVLAGVLVAGVVLLLLTQALAPLALGEAQRLTVDLGLSGISILGLLVIVMVGASLVGKEIERRTIFNLLSRPISRPAYLIGKWIGLAGALWVLVAVLAAGLWGVLAVRGLASHGPAVATAAYLAGLELTVLTAVAVMFSALSTPVLSALYTLGLYCVGQWRYDLRAFARQFPDTLHGAVDVVANLVPNLPLFNARSLAAAGQVVDPLHLGLATLYALVYSACALSLAAAAFESRDFK